MPIYKHKDTGKRFFFIHIPKTAGRFLQENFKLNGFEPEQLIWKHVDGIEIAHFHRELYQKHLNIKDIKHVTIDDVTHFMLSEKPFEVYEYIEKYLTSNHLL